MEQIVKKKSKNLFVITSIISTIVITAWSSIGMASSSSSS